MQKTALFSLYDTHSAASYARSLVDLGWNIVATMETVPLLKQENIPCQDIYTFTGIDTDYGFPPTLHPRMEHALTVENSPYRIDLVYVISYPMDVGNDVGGRTLLALAAKGRRIPVMSRENMHKVITSLQHQVDLDPELKQSLINQTNQAIAEHFLRLAQEDGLNSEVMAGKLAYPLMNGENPYQRAELFSFGDDDPLAIPKFKNLSETVICQVNLSDVDNLLNNLCLTADAFAARFGKVPFLAVASKHGNVCGAAFDWNEPAACIKKALFGNPLAVWGGEVMTNFPVDESCTDILIHHPEREALLGSATWMLDVVAAPSFSPPAAERLLKRKWRKVLANPALSSPNPLLEGFSYRHVRGGFIRQTPPWRGLRPADFSQDSPTISESDHAGLITAWAAAFTSFHGGNEIALVKDGALLGVGGGPSTVEAAQVAVERARQAGHNLQDSIFCADAFFPFTDAPEILVKAGVRLGMVPAGGKNEPLVRAFFTENLVQMVYLPEDFRGFCRH